MMSKRMSNLFNEMIKETLKSNIETFLDELSGGYDIVTHDMNDAHRGIAEREDGFSGRIPIVFGFNVNVFAPSHRKIFLLWRSLFDDTDIMSLTNEEWQAAFRSFREATTAITLTQVAWRDCQLIPLGSIRQSFLPPLAFPERKPCSEQILLIDHGADERSVGGVMDALALEGFETAIWSRSGSDRYNAGGDIFTSAIHLHLGAHSVYDSPIRVIDSWNNRRCVIQYSGGDLDRDDVIKIETGVNGILARSIDELLSALRTIKCDDVLRERIISISLLKARQLSRQWRSETKAILE